MHIAIRVDTNDADYITNIEPITEEQLNKIRTVIQAIKNFKPYKAKYKGIEWTHSHNWPYGECCREDLGEKTVEQLYGDIEGFAEFVDLVPQDEYGAHTIESIEIIEKKEILL